KLTAGGLDGRRARRGVTRVHDIVGTAAREPQSCQQDRQNAHMPLFCRVDARKSRPIRLILAPARPRNARCARRVQAVKAPTAARPMNGDGLSRWAVNASTPPSA